MFDTITVLSAIWRGMLDDARAELGARRSVRSLVSIAEARALARALRQAATIFEALAEGETMPPAAKGSAS